MRGAPGAVLDGQGALWWDGVGNGGGTIKTKPKFFKANNLNDSLLEGLYILDAPINSFSLNYVRNLTLRGVTVNNTAAEAPAANNETLGHNTDAFDINNADGVVITGARVWNQDDCVAVNSGQNILFKDGFCSGGHGLSIGSVGGRDNNDVRNVTFEDVVMERSQQSVRIVSRNRPSPPPPLPPLFPSWRKHILTPGPVSTRKPLPMPTAPSPTSRTGTFRYPRVQSTASL